MRQSPEHLPHTWSDFYFREPDRTRSQGSYATKPGSSKP